ncbi:DUF397 domain-containing protein [Streptomyces sp. NPDC059378]|uniref:DUF397 domain-containing protein n=1 Tax=Streptomyces sp. NPDC059378 TaxID=3346815 RepID=UPI0036A1F59D
MDGRPWTWRRASASDAAGNQCVEVRFSGRQIFVRDSVRPQGPHLALSHGAWQSFLDALQSPGSTTR